MTERKNGERGKQVLYFSNKKDLLYLLSVLLKFINVVSYNCFSCYLRQQAEEQKSMC